MRKLALLLLIFSCGAGARIEILIPGVGMKMSTGSCRNFWIKLMVPGPTRYGSSVDGQNQIGLVKATKQQVRETYRALGTANEKELDHMLTEDDSFPGASVVYIRSVSDFDGKAEGIMRVVTTDQGPDFYYNFLLTNIERPGAAKVPLFYNYPKAEFRAFLAAKYPRPTELGKLVFGEGVNKIRVLNDLVVAANQLIYFPQSKKYRPDQHHVVVEAVPYAVRLYEQYGLKAEETPITLDNGRVFMHIPEPDFYRAFVGDILAAKLRFEAIDPHDKAALKAAIADFDRAIAKVSPSIAVRNTYTFGIFHRAIAYYQMDDFGGMLKDVKLLLRHNPQSREFRLLELFGEAGSRFNFVTGEGDLRKAIDFLDTPEAKERFANDKLPEATYPQARLFLKGLLYIGAGKYAEAKQMRIEIDDYLQGLEREAQKVGSHYLVTPQTVHGRMSVLTLKETIFDPENGQGDSTEALNQIAIAAQEGTAGLTSDLYDYRAAVLRYRGDGPGAEKAKAIADGLR